MHKHWTKLIPAPKNVLQLYYSFYFSKDLQGGEFTMCLSCPAVPQLRFMSFIPLVWSEVVTLGPISNDMRLRTICKSGNQSWNADVKNPLCPFLNTRAVIYHTSNCVSGLGGILITGNLWCVPAPLRSLQSWRVKMQLISPNCSALICFWQEEFQIPSPLNG